MEYINKSSQLTFCQIVARAFLRRQFDKMLAGLYLWPVWIWISDSFIQHLGRCDSRSAVLKNHNTKKSAGSRNLKVFQHLQQVSFLKYDLVKVDNYFFSRTKNIFHNNHIYKKCGF